jgi:hypothetical protein
MATPELYALAATEKCCPMTFAYCRRITCISVFDQQTVDMVWQPTTLYLIRISEFPHHRKGERSTVRDTNDVRLGLAMRVSVLHTNYKRSTVPRSTYNIQNISASYARNPSRSLSEAAHHLCGLTMLRVKAAE